MSMRRSLVECSMVCLRLLSIYWFFHIANVAKAVFVIGKHWPYIIANIAKALFVIGKHWPYIIVISILTVFAHVKMYQSLKVCKLHLPGRSNILFSLALRITFIYGLLWEHKNLTELTHNTLHEFFGYVTSLVSAQLALTMRRNKLVSATGEDIYLPDSDKGLKSSVYKKHIERLDLPIRFIVGELILYYPIP